LDSFKKKKSCQVDGFELGFCVDLAGAQNWLHDLRLHLDLWLTSQVKYRSKQTVTLIWNHSSTTWIWCKFDWIWYNGYINEQFCIALTEPRIVWMRECTEKRPRTWCTAALNIKTRSLRSGILHLHIFVDLVKCMYSFMAADGILKCGHKTPVSVSIRFGAWRIVSVWRVHC